MSGGKPMKPCNNWAKVWFDPFDGLAFTVGDSLTLAAQYTLGVLPSGAPGASDSAPSYLTPLLAGAGGSLWSDANGVTGEGAATTGTPGAYIPGAVYLEELVGTFADNGVIVGTPFAIGNGPTTVTIASGANELLMGVVDGWYNDNGGSVDVNVTETAATVPDVGSTVFLLGIGLGGIALLRRWAVAL
jgi:hypothetical protein